MTLATIRYDFESSEYVVALEDTPDCTYSDSTLEGALALLRHDYNKHELWPNRS